MKNFITLRKLRSFGGFEIGTQLQSRLKIEDGWIGGDDPGDGFIEVLAIPSDEISDDGGSHVGMMGQEGFVGRDDTIAEVGMAIGPVHGEGLEGFEQFLGGAIGIPEVKLFDGVDGFVFLELDESRCPCAEFMG